MYVYILSMIIWVVTINPIMIHIGWWINVIAEPIFNYDQRNLIRSPVPKMIYVRDG